MRTFQNTFARKRAESLPIPAKNTNEVAAQNRIEGPHISPLAPSRGKRAWTWHGGDLPIREVDDQILKRGATQKKNNRSHMEASGKTHQRGSGSASRKIEPCPADPPDPAHARTGKQSNTRVRWKDQEPDEESSRGRKSFYLRKSRSKKSLLQDARPSSSSVPRVDSERGSNRGNQSGSTHERSSDAPVVPPEGSLRQRLQAWFSKSLKRLWKGLKTGLCLSQSEEEGSE